MSEIFSSAAALDAVPLAVAMIQARSQRILYVNSFFSDNVMKKGMAEEMNFQDLLKDLDKYKMETNISLLQTETEKPLRSVSLGILSTLSLHGKEGFPLFNPFNWTISIVDGNPDQLLLTGAPEILVKEEYSDSNVTTIDEFIDFFQNAPIALHWLSGVSCDTSVCTHKYMCTYTHKYMFKHTYTYSNTQFRHRTYHLGQPN